MIREHLPQGLIHQESLIHGRAHFCTLAIQGQRWNFMNVYAPNSRTEREILWERIHLQVAGEEEWCIGGDFNMIKSLHDSLNNNPIVLQGRSERKHWEKLCVHSDSGNVNSDIPTTSNREGTPKGLSLIFLIRWVELSTHPILH